MNAPLEIRTDLRQAVFALSDALDLVGVDDYHHGKRVGLMAVECGRALGLESAGLNFLLDAGLLHDCGVSSTEIHHHLVEELDWSGAQAHCERGHALLSGFAPLAPLAPLILYHHTHWDKLSTLELDDRTKLFSNLIFLADRVDTLAAPHYGQQSLLFYRGQIRDTIARHSGTFFAPRLMEAFLHASENEAFWLYLEPPHIHTYLSEMSQHRQQQLIDFPQLRQLAEIFSRIVDAKSTFTVEHSHGVSNLARLLGELAGLPEASRQKLEIAGLLHDLGKLRVPDEILEKPAKLTPEERATMERHSFETYQILRRIPGLEEIARWAAYHHEAPDGEGYPFHRKGSELPPEARIISVADVFQALAQNRPYRAALLPAEVIDRLRKLSAEGHLDAAVVELAGRNLDACWRAATGHPL